MPFLLETTNPPASPDVSPFLIIASIVGYFIALLGVAWWTGRRADAGGYFLGNKASPWWAVALGLIGDSLSGVSYISVPGAVGVGRWYYLQVVFGYVIGYGIIIHVLLPLYYRLNLTSIYGYLGLRFDRTAQRRVAAHEDPERNSPASGQRNPRRSPAQPIEETAPFPTRSANSARHSI